VVARSLFALTKPRIIELLLVTTIPTMLLAQRGLPSIRVLLVTLVAGACAAGSANTINCYIDRDIDAIMRRTSRRPLNGRGREAAVIKPTEALVFGILLGVVSTILLGTLVNWLSAVLADTAILFYVFVYTLGLKRRTPSNIVIGGADRLVRRDRPGQPARGGPVRGDLLLDSAALLGAGHEVPR
jgi:protoheme IX farnesyltransferase